MLLMKSCLLFITFEYHNYSTTLSTLYVKPSAGCVCKL